MLAFPHSLFQKEGPSAWTVATCNLNHTLPCTPSEAMKRMCRRAKGSKCSSTVLTGLISLVDAEASVSQVRMWIQRHGVNLLIDSQSILNLMARVVAAKVRFDDVAH